MKKIRFIHGADLHLDSPFQGLRELPEKIFQQVRESTFDALQTLINHAINHQVDFILLAGDLFDGENRSLKAQSKLKKALEQLHTYKINCYVIHGNHDHLKGSWVTLTWPENVFFFKDEVEVKRFIKEDTLVHLYGYSYPTKVVKENISASYEKWGNADFHIGILHGTAQGQEGHDHYAPFSVRQLVEKEFDYWALGHIHKKQILNEDPYVVYSGNIQGRHKKELGEKGVYLVELETNQTSLQFLPTASIVWEEVTVSIEGLHDVEQLKNRCEEAIFEKQTASISVLIIISFIGSGPLHAYLVEQGDELIEVLNIEQEEKEFFTYVVDKKIATVGEWDREALKQEQHLLSDIITVSENLVKDETMLLNVLSEVYNHPKLKPYLVNLNEEEQKQLLQDAQTYLLTSLLKERGE